MNQSDDDLPLVDLTNSSSPRTESVTTNPSSVTLPSTKPHRAEQPSAEQTPAKQPLLRHLLGSHALPGQHQFLLNMIQMDMAVLGRYM